MSYQTINLSKSRHFAGPNRRHLTIANSTSKSNLGNNAPINSSIVPSAVAQSKIGSVILDPLSTTPTPTPVSTPYRRHSKIVATIGPATCDTDTFPQLVQSGINVARLNMSHGDHESHAKVIELIKEHNDSSATPIAVMLDTKGPEVRSGDLSEPIDMKKGDEFTFTIREGATGQDGIISVNYDGFIDDVGVGDELLVDGGMISFKVTNIETPNVTVVALDDGVMKSRRHLNVRGKSATLPSITDKDRLDIDFGIKHQVDYYALSFVKSADVIIELKEYLAERNADIMVLAKIESADAVSSQEQLDAILDAVDGAMVARGDLGAELPFQCVPLLQEEIIRGCRKRGKPVIVATNMLESMIENPTPTRAEVSDIAIAVREGTDAVMLSGETAYGKYPFRSVQTMSEVAVKSELEQLKYKGIRKYGSEDSDPIDWINRVDVSKTEEQVLSETMAYHATTMANTMNAHTLAFTRKGAMPKYLSHYRPKRTIFAFTEQPAVARRLALYHGVTPVVMKYAPTANETFETAMRLCVENGYLYSGERVLIVQGSKKPIWTDSSAHAIQVSTVPLGSSESTSSGDD